jgi:hypothetical protein
MNYDYQYNNKLNFNYIDNKHNQENDEDSSYDSNSPDSTSNKITLKTKGKKRQRQENSLGELTKNFVTYIRQQKETEIDINLVVKKLKVKKRRIYDITNVLEGILIFFIIKY